MAVRDELEAAKQPIQQFVTELRKAGVTEAALAYALAAEFCDAANRIKAPAGFLEELAGQVSHMLLTWELRHG